VLVNVPQRETLLAEMLRRVTPGGSIALEDIEDVSWLCEPEHPSWIALITAFDTGFRAGGGDPFIGRRLPALLQACGVGDARARVWSELPQFGQYRRTHLVSLVDSMRREFCKCS
jgi:hypothetical protein